MENIPWEVLKDKAGKGHNILLLVPHSIDWNSIRQPYLEVNKTRRCSLAHAHEEEMSLVKGILSLP